MQYLKTVIHVHSDHSFDANASPADIIRTARRQGVDCVAITDHNTIAGAIEARRIGGVRVIVGEEITSAGGHMIGLFLHERIPPGLSIEETAGRIREQGGVVLAPHPLATLCARSLGADNLVRHAHCFDAIEIGNAQNPFFWEDWRTARLARELGMTAYIGADTHLRGHLAAGHQLLPPFDDATTFLASLAQARLVPGRFGPTYFGLMGVRHFWDKLLPKRLPGFGGNAHDRETRSKSLREPLPVSAD